MIIKYDLDGTITNEDEWDSLDEARCYMRRTPNMAVVIQMRLLLRKGHVIFIETCRRERWRSLTEEWLDVHAVPYHVLVMNKTPCDLSVDDRNATIADVESQPQLFQAPPTKRHEEARVIHEKTMYPCEGMTGEPHYDVLDPTTRESEMFTSETFSRGMAEGWIKPHGTDGWMLLPEKRNEAEALRARKTNAQKKEADA